jgi:hypothetical protein
MARSLTAPTGGVRFGHFASAFSIRRHTFGAPPGLPDLTREQFADR